MKVLFWLSIGLDRQATSGHLLIAMIEQLCKSDHTVHILQKATGGNLPPIPKQLQQYPVTTDCIPFIAADKGNFVARYFKELNYIRQCKKYIKPGYEAVFMQSTTVGGYAVKIARSKLPNSIITFNVQDIFPYNAVYSGSIAKDGIIFKVMAAQQRYAYKHADHVITISEDMKDLLVEDGTPKDKIKVIYNWSYQDELYDQATLDFTPVAHMFHKDYFNVVYAGNIGVMQNVDILIEAAKLMKEDKTVWFHIIGNGVYKDKLKARAKAYGIINISFWPIQPSELAPLIYCAADVNVIPLVKDVYKTALPSKTATCMACRKPIIFAIGKDSRFGQRVEKETCCPVVESDKTGELVDVIRKIKSGIIAPKTDRFFLQNMGITFNSMKYARVILKR